jgi:hypothetical protein
MQELKNDSLNKADKKGDDALIPTHRESPKGSVLANIAHATRFDYFDADCWFIYRMVTKCKRQFESQPRSCILSTLLSPITTPLGLNIFGSITTGDYSQDLYELAHQGTNAFMMLTDVIPSLIGIATHFLMGDKRVNACKPFLKVANYAMLLFLNYSNASTSLPQVIKQPDVDFLVFVCGTVTVLCIAAFGAGFALSKWLHTGRSEQAALMFGLGMNNKITAPGSFLPQQQCQTTPQSCYQ